jgi:hypothetical protein
VVSCGQVGRWGINDRGDKRWQALFADLSGELEAEAELERRAEISDRVREEHGRLRLIDRLRPQLDVVGRELRVGVAGHGAVRGLLTGLGPDWMVLTSAPATEWLIPTSAVAWLRDLPPLSAEPGWEGTVGARLTLRVALRRVLRDRSRVVVGTIDAGTASGLLSRVGSDFVELHEPSSSAAQRAAGGLVTTVPLTAIAFVRRP